VPALLVATIGLIAVAGPSVADHEPREPMLGPVIRPLVSLKGWVPPQPELTGIVRNKDALVILGKAMFWDMQAGSDGMACATSTAAPIRASATCSAPVYAAFPQTRIIMQWHRGDPVIPT